MKSKKTGGRDFQKGHPGGPGRPKLSEDVKILQHDTAIETRKWIFEIWNMHHSDLFEYETKTDIPSGKKALASCLNNCIQVGAVKELSLFLDRILGKPKEVIEHSGPDGGGIPIDNQIVDVLKSAFLDRKK